MGLNNELIKASVMRVRELLLDIIPDPEIFPELDNRDDVFRIGYDNRLDLTIIYCVPNNARKDYSLNEVLNLKDNITIMYIYSGKYDMVASFINDVSGYRVLNYYDFGSERTIYEDIIYSNIDDVYRRLPENIVNRASLEFYKETILSSPINNFKKSDLNSLNKDTTQNKLNIDKIYREKVFRYLYEVSKFNLSSIENDYGIYDFESEEDNYLKKIKIVNPFLIDIIKIQIETDVEKLATFLFDPVLIIRETIESIVLFKQPVRSIRHILKSIGYFHYINKVIDEIMNSKYIYDIFEVDNILDTKDIKEIHIFGVKYNIQNSTRFELANKIKDLCDHKECTVVVNDNILSIS